MSRIGKKPITIPEGVQAKLQDNALIIKGSKGELQEIIHPLVKIEIKDNQIILSMLEETKKKDKALWGLFGSLVKNMIKGVQTGYEKKMEVIGTGYKVNLQGNKLIISVGFSHPVEFVLPAGISASVEKNTITLNGFDKQLIGETAARIRRIKKPEPYKGKGIRYAEEIIKKKVGKTSAKGA